MAARIITTLILIVTLALVYLAPQGLLTKPKLEQELRGPFVLRDLEMMDDQSAYFRAYDLGTQDTTIEAGWSPVVLNERMITAGDTVQFGYAFEFSGTRSGLADTASTFVHLPRDTYLIAQFPNRGQFSARLGAWKVYKGFQHEVMRRGLLPGPVLEIHEVDSEEILYLLPFLERDTQE